ncbi:MAG: FAD-dependent oxidoreductase [Frankiales bacterium]|jgi:FAD-linked oxidoreductase|nr:FAD-dependent oxidoreductase [Frankiales bacterium]
MHVMWRNWAGNQSMTPAAVEHPASVDEVSRVVKEAAAAGRRVKAIGSGHSFTGIGLTDGVLVQLDRVDQLVSADADTGRVVVQGGLPLWRLNALLAERGLGLTNMGDVDRQTVTGAICTGTHGTGRDSGALATQVLAMELVLADGSLLTCSREENPDVFAAARVSLGALGIVTSVTIQAEGAFLLTADEQPMPLLDVVDDFERHVAENEHFELYWFPHTDLALTKRNNRTSGPAKPLSTARKVVEDEVLSNGFFEATCRIGKAFPAAIPRINRAVSKALSARTYTDAAPQVFTAKRRVRFKEMEYAIPRSELPGVLRELRTLPERHGQRISFPVEVRVAPADDITLSTASGRDTAYVAVHVYKGTDEKPYFDAVEALMGTVGGRPHWGKLHSLAAEQLRERYPRFEEFTALRDRLDPERRFTNAYLDRVLGA